MDNDMILIDLTIIINIDSLSNIR